MSSHSSPLAEKELCACPLCGADAPEPSSYGEKGFAVARCGACQLWYLSPRLPEVMMAAAYRSGAYFGGADALRHGKDGTGYDDYGNQEASLKATFRRLVQEIARRGLAGGSLLEIGCGYGYFLQEAALCFERRCGTELSPPAAARARRAADCVWDGGIDAVPTDAAFDCIVAFHVIEHVYEPRAFMAHLLRHLKPGGHCILAAPDMGSLWRRLMGARWPSFKYPEHVAFYDAATLGRLMREAGLSDITPLPYPHAFPLGQICRKLGLPVAGAFGGLNIWLPGTTVAAVGTLPGGPTL